MSGDIENRIIKKGWITTVMGIPIFLFGVFMIVGKVYDAITGKCPDCHFSVVEITSTVVLGYALIMAKDTLIEGLTLGLFKLKK